MTIKAEFTLAGGELVSRQGYRIVLRSDTAYTKNPSTTQRPSARSKPCTRPNSGARTPKKGVFTSMSKGFTLVSKENHAIAPC